MWACGSGEELLPPRRACVLSITQPHVGPDMITQSWEEARRDFFFGRADSWSPLAHCDRTARIGSRQNCCFMPSRRAARDVVGAAGDSQGVTHLLAHRHAPASSCSGRGAQLHNATIWQISIGKSRFEVSLISHRPERACALPETINF